MSLPHFGISYCDMCRKNNILRQGWRYKDSHYCGRHLEKIQRLKKLKEKEEK